MTLLSSFQSINACIIGASGGIGRAFVDHLIALDNVENIHALSRSAVNFNHDKVISGAIDLRNEDSIQKAADDISHDLNLIIVAAGLLHDGGVQPEKALKDLNADAFEKIFNVNTFGPALAMKYFLPKLPREGKSVFASLSARVGSISDNHLGGWYAYRASKAALNMITKTAAIETARKYKDASIIGLHPGTVDTNLSDPFQSHVKDGKLFTPSHATEQMLSVIDGVKPEQSGLCFAYDGEIIDF